MTTRLPGRDYKTVFGRGRSARGRYLVAWRMALDTDARLAGVVVSKRSLRLAVERSRAKRLVREAFRLLAKDARVPGATAWVFVARAGIRGAKMDEVRQDMLKLCAKC